MEVHPARVPAGSRTYLLRQHENLHDEDAEENEARAGHVVLEGGQRRGSVLRGEKETARDRSARRRLGHASGSLVGPRPRTPFVQRRLRDRQAGDEQPSSPATRTATLRMSCDCPTP